MELDTSSTIMISAPLALCSFSLAPICGRERPMAKKPNATENRTTFTQPRERDQRGMSRRTISSSPKRRSRRTRRYRPMP